MELRYSEYHEAEEAGEEPNRTEVIFMDYESRSRQKLIDNLPESRIPYDKTVFPEQIILYGHYYARDVHRVMTGYTSGLRRRNLIVAQGPRRTERIPDNKYL